VGLADPQWFDFQLDDGQTPLDPDEARGLRLSWVATRGDLNDAEGTNILDAMRWAVREIRKKQVVVPSEDFLRQLHARMFGEVWEWAGRFRSTERNIGVAPHQVAMQLRQLFDDAGAWQVTGTYSLDEQAARLHHRLTYIHPFPNGNGRCSRLMADLFLQSRGAQPFTWGPAPHGHQVRQRYLEALRLADAGDLAALLGFVRS
jgi:Fic-DOC domain mobile mystery protein B